MRATRALVAIVAVLAANLGLVATPVQAAKSKELFVQVVKVTPSYVTARFRCPPDPNPDGTQWLHVAGYFEDETIFDPAVYRLDVASLCDLKRHTVKVPFYEQDSAVADVGDRVDVSAYISGDSGEIFASRDDVRVRR